MIQDNGILNKIDNDQPSVTSKQEVFANSTLETKSMNLDMIDISQSNVPSAKMFDQHKGRFKFSAKASTCNILCGGLADLFAVESLMKACIS